MIFAALLALPTCGTPSEIQPDPHCSVQHPLEAVVDSVRFTLQAPDSVRYGEPFDLGVEAVNMSQSFVRWEPASQCLVEVGLRGEMEVPGSRFCSIGWLYLAAGGQTVFDLYTGVRSPDIECPPFPNTDEHPECLGLPAQQGTYCYWGVIATDQDTVRIERTIEVRP